MKRLFAVLFFAVSLVAMQAAQTAVSVGIPSYWPRTNAIADHDVVFVGTGLGTTNEHLQSIYKSDFGSNILSVIQISTATVNGLLSSNTMSELTVRDGHHSDQAVPPLGYTTWLDNGVAVSEAIVSNQIVQMKANGTTARHKFRWINIDDGWSQTNRDASGNLVADPAKFPSGISGTCQLAHTNGFKLMWYMVAGDITAGFHPGSKGYMFQDVTNLYLRGADAVRICNDDSGYDYADFANNSPNLYLAQQVFPAINMMSRPFSLSLRTGQYRTWLRNSVNFLEWSPGLNTTSGKSLFDINSSQTNSIDALDFYQPRTYLAGPYHFLDAGTATQTGHQGPWANFGIGAGQRVMSIWAMLHLPMWHPNWDMAASYKYVWTNDYMLDIHQDPLVAPCSVISSNYPIEILATPLANNGVAIGFYNRSYAPDTTAATLYWTNENLQLPAGSYDMVDVWNYTTFVNSSNSFRVSLTNDQFALYKLTPHVTTYTIPVPYVTNMDFTLNTWYTNENDYPAHIQESWRQDNGASGSSMYILGDTNLDGSADITIGWSVYNVLSSSLTTTIHGIVPGHTAFVYTNTAGATPSKIANSGIFQSWR